jgi:hypothetical protein
MNRFAPAQPDALSRLLDQIRQRHMQLVSHLQDTASTQAPTRADLAGKPAANKPQLDLQRWTDQRPSPDSVRPALRAGLEAWGLLPVHATQVANEAAQYLGHRSSKPGAELGAVRAALAQHWRPASPAGCGWHVWVGAPGVGKSTCLSKWLAQLAIRNPSSLRVWRLDSSQANTAEALSVLAEALGVPVSRHWPHQPQAQPNETHLIDLPGLDWQDADALAQLHRCLHPLPAVQVHLVLNAAYETRLWMAQIQAFAQLPVCDLIFTHLDEERRWGKLWNAVLGTKFAVAFLNAGQNVPGEFWPATVDALLPRQWPPVSDPIEAVEGSSADATTGLPAASMPSTQPATVVG